MQRHPLSADLLNALAFGRGRYEMTCDVRYGTCPRLSLDVYTPTIADNRAPVLVFLYGGGWEGGDKASYRFVGASLAARGLVTVIPDYRVYPQVRFPTFLEDVALALRWVHDNVKAYGGDPDRLLLAGHSAGAHIAAMLAFDRQWLAAHCLDPSRNLKGMIGLAGPYDFLPLRSERLKDIFGSPGSVAASQPIAFVDGTGPPAFLATGGRDRVVAPGNTIRMANRIREAGGRATLKIYPHAGHAILVGAFAAPLRLFAPVLRDSLCFAADVSGQFTSHATARRARQPA